MKVSVSISIPEELFDEIEERRGLIGRSTYYHEIIKKGIELMNVELEG